MAAAGVYPRTAPRPEPTPEARRLRAEKTAATIAANAAVVFRGYRTWRYCHRKADGHPFFMLEGSPVRQPDGSEKVPTYSVDLHDCECPSHRDGKVACKHMQAVRLWFEAVKRGEIVVPKRMTPADAAVLEADAAVAVELDVAEAADAMLDAYHEDLRRREAARFREPEQAWWERPDGGIVWLMPGDRIGPDTAPPVEVGAEPCRARGCEILDVDPDGYCARHALVDAF